MSESTPVAENLPPLSNEELAALETPQLQALIQELGDSLNGTRPGGLAFAWADKYRNRVIRELAERDQQ